ncbi:MAG: CPXCG motif-containing cysteine-rich protein [Bacteroidota bacterium]
MINEEYSGTFRCAVCGEKNETFVDLSAGSIQSYVEDCAVCCRPNVLHIRIDEFTGNISLETEFEG